MQKSFVELTLNTCSVASGYIQFKNLRTYGERRLNFIRTEVFFSYNISMVFLGMTMERTMINRNLTALRVHYAKLLFLIRFSQKSSVVQR